MATSSVRGSSKQRIIHDQEASLTPIANTDSRSCPAGHGTPSPTSGRRVSADSWTTSNATVTPASRQSYTVDGYQLGKWVNVQRINHTKGTLDADRQHRLEDLPGWTWDPYADQWEEGFSRLLDYVERHGDARVPKSYTVDGYRLGTWVTTQRDKHAKGTLDADRQRRLQDLPGWTWDRKADMWEEGFSRLSDYVERHGHARVPTSYTVDGYRLGAWG